MKPCPLCTFSNPLANDACEMCEYEFISEVVVVPCSSNEEGPTCVRCTFYNPVGVDLCRMCGQELKGMTKEDNSDIIEVSVRSENCKADPIVNTELSRPGKLEVSNESSLINSTSRIVSKFALLNDDVNESFVRNPILLKSGSVSDILSTRASPKKRKTSELAESLEKLPNIVKKASNRFKKLAEKEPELFVISVDATFTGLEPFQERVESISMECSNSSIKLILHPTKMICKNMLEWKKTQSGVADQIFFTVLCLTSAEFLEYYSNNRMPSLVESVLVTASLNKKNLCLVIIVVGLYDALNAYMNVELKKANNIDVSRSDVLDFSKVPFRTPVALDKELLAFSFHYQNQVHFRIEKTFERSLEYLHLVTKNFISSKSSSVAVSKLNSLTSVKPTGLGFDVSTTNFRLKSWFNILLQIPRVSENVAAAIIRVHPTFSHLFKSILVKSEIDAKQYLENIEIKPEDSLGGKRMRLGPDLASKIYTCIMR